MYRRRLSHRLVSSASILGALSLLLLACSERDKSLVDEQGILEHGSSQGTGQMTKSTPTSTPTADTSGTQAPKKTLAIKAMSAGHNSTCALMSDDSLRCWGDNAHGQLGIGHTQQIGIAPAQMGAALQSVALPAGTKITRVHTGESSCVQTEDKKLFCWGRNAQGQLGLGNNQNVGANSGEMGKNMMSVPIGPDAQVQDFCVGLGHTCAVLQGGTVKCWGLNTYGQLGLGHSDSVGLRKNQMGELLPFVDLGETGKPKVPRRAQKISCGANHTCVLSPTGEVTCWGRNNKGQLGRGSTTNIGDQPEEMGKALMPAPFDVRSKIVDLQSAGNNNCALTQAGTIHCWGDNERGQLGLGNTEMIGAKKNKSVEQLFSGIDLGTKSPVTQIAMGEAHVCALTSDGQVRCWGSNRLGELGAGMVLSVGAKADQMGPNLVPVDLGAGFVATDITAGSTHTCARNQQGQVRCWGFNQQGQLGLGDQLTRGNQSNQMGDALPLVKVLP